MEPMTDEQLQKIRARCEAAATGPWVFDGMHPEIQTPYSDRGFWLICSEGGDALSSDFEFIAAARTDIPTLLDEVDRLKARVAELENTAQIAREIDAQIKAIQGHQEASRNTDLFIGGCEAEAES